jgi:hypothetical protein
MYLILAVLTLLALLATSISMLLHVPNCDSSWDARLVLVRLAHYFVSFYFVLFGLFATTSLQKALYIAVTTMMILHWIVINDCVLTAMESAKNTSASHCSNMHFRVFFGDRTDAAVKVYIALIFLNLVATLWRLDLHDAWIVKALLLLSLLCVAIVSFRQYRTPTPDSLTL